LPPQVKAGVPGKKGATTVPGTFTFLPLSDELPGEIVVDGNDMHAAFAIDIAFESIEISGQSGNEGFSFAGHHFGDGTAVEYHSAHELYVIMAESQHAPTSFPADGKGFNEQIVKGFAKPDSFPELIGFRPELFVGEFSPQKFLQPVRVH
jgi:hypothetical protein